jgi:hypothetical protein
LWGVIGLHLPFFLSSIVERVAVPVLHAAETPDGCYFAIRILAHPTNDGFDVLVGLLLDGGGGAGDDDREDILKEKCVVWSHKPKWDTALV